MIKYLFSIPLLMSIVHAQEHVLNSHKVIDVSIAQEGFTRISVEGETIQHVFCHPASVEEYVKLHAGGHIFVVGEGLKSPLHLSLVTDKGNTQDLKLTAKRKPIEPIILKAPSKKLPDTETIPEILESFVKGHQSPDFKITGLNVLPREQESLKYYPLKSWIKGHHKIILWQVKNISEETIQLSPAMVRQKEDSGIILMQRDLLPHHITHFYVYQNNN